MKKILTFLFIVLFIPNVFASETNVSNKVRCSTSDTKCVIGTDITSGLPITGFYNIGTRYTAKLTQLVFYISSSDYNFVSGKTYTMTINMATEDWRNHFMGPIINPTNSDLSVPSTAHNWSTGSVTFVSMKKIKFNFQVKDTPGAYVKFLLYSGNSTPFTGVTNFQISSITINDNVSTPTPVPAVTPTPTPTPQASNKDIINNANQNTQDIINNNNTNTQDIINNSNQNNSDVIDNANQNTQDIIDSNKNNFNVCYYNYFDIYKVGQVITSLGRVERIGDRSIEVQAMTSGHTEVSSRTLSTLAPDLQIGETYTLTFTRSNVQDYIYLTSGFIWNNGSTRTITQADLDSTVYFYVSSNLGTGRYNNLMIQKSNGNIATAFIPNGETCSNRLDQVNNALGVVGLKIDTSSGAITGAISGAISSVNQNSNNNQAQTNQKLDDINNSINNDNVDDKTSFFTNFDNDSHGLTGIITLPLTTIQNLANSSCVSLSIPIPFTNSNVSLPCMTQVYQTYIPSVFSIWQVVSFGIISYLICLDIFKMVKGFKDPNDDKVEVLDL